MASSYLTSLSMYGDEAVTGDREEHTDNDGEKVRTPEEEVGLEAEHKLRK